MSDQETLDVYNTQASDYAAKFSRRTPDSDLQAFMNALPKGAHTLDFGCGPGNSAAIMQGAGFKADATDASCEMIKMAKSEFGVNAKLATFAELDAVDTYDGIWANFSLLHAPRADMPTHLGQLHRALKPNGLLHLGLKLGEGSGRDHLGRLYTYFSEPELRELLKTAGFTIKALRTDSMKGLAGTDDPFIIILANA